MAQGTRAYLDGTGALKSALTGSNGTADTTGVTLFDVNGNTLGLALDGADATGITPPAGGAGIRGWLSGIFSLLSNTLSVTLKTGSSVIGAVTQSGGPWTTADAANGSASGGTAAGFSQLVGGVSRSTLPTLTNGQQAGLTLDSNGRVLVASSLASPNVVTVTPTVTIGTYAAKQCLGGLLTFNGALPTLKGVIEEVEMLVANADAPAVAGTLYLFDALPTGGGATADHANAGIATLDMGKIVAAWQITAAADPSGANVPAYGSSAGGSSNTAHKLINAGNSTIYGLFVINTATSFAGANDVTFRLKTLSY
jgi:hypothetical protein